MATWRQQGRHKAGTTGGNSLHPTQQWMGNITVWSGFGYMEATNRVVRVRLGGGDKEGPGQELLAATHCNTPSNGWGT